MWELILEIIDVMLDWFAIPDWPFSKKSKKDK